MIYFVKNSYLDSGIITDKTKFIEDFDISKCSNNIIETPVLFKNPLKFFKLTNKGGRRLIDYIKKIDEIYTNAVILYSESELNYILSTDPNKLYSPTELSASKLISGLINSDITQFYYHNWKLTPKSFKNPKALRDWILIEDPKLGVKLLNELRSYKEGHPEFLIKDLKEFSSEFSTLDEICNKYGFDKSLVTEGMSYYFL